MYVILSGKDHMSRCLKLFVYGDPVVMVRVLLPYKGSEVFQRGLREVGVVDCW